jgi:uncharacterized protein YjiS (DUF1127 family)
MSAPLTKEQLAFSLGNQTYISPLYEETGTPSVKPENRGVIAFFDGIFAKYAEWRRRRRVVEEMTMMTHRELSDIGLTRSDLSRVFDPQFAADHQRGRDYIAY